MADRVSASIATGGTVSHAQSIGQLGSMRAIRCYNAQAEIELPPFAVAANEATDCDDQQRQC